MDRSRTTGLKPATGRLAGHWPVISAGNLGFHLARKSYLISPAQRACVSEFGAHLPILECFRFGRWLCIIQMINEYIYYVSISPLGLVAQLLLEMMDFQIPRHKWLLFTKSFCVIARYQDSFFIVQRWWTHYIWWYTIPFKSACMCRLANPSMSALGTRMEISTAEKYQRVASAESKWRSECDWP